MSRLPCCSGTLFRCTIQNSIQCMSWISPTSVPKPLLTSRFVLEPLAEKHAEMDFAALMSCRARLRRELQWGQWPPDDFNLPLNRADLRRHQNEFENDEAFAYTVLRPDRARCLGCIYIEHCAEIDGAQLAFWVVDEARAIEATLVVEVVAWIHTAWSQRRLVLPFRSANTCGIGLARMCGLVQVEIFQDGPLSEYCCFLSDSGTGESCKLRSSPS